MSCWCWVFPSNHLSHEESNDNNKQPSYYWATRCNALPHFFFPSILAAYSLCPTQLIGFGSMDGGAIGKSQKLIAPTLYLIELRQTCIMFMPLWVHLLVEVQDLVLAGNGDNITGSLVDNGQKSNIVESDSQKYNINGVRSTYLMMDIISSILDEKLDTRSKWRQV